MCQDGSARIHEEGGHTIRACAHARRGSLAIWFDSEMQWQAAPTGKRGRQPLFTDAAIQTCLTLKALFGLPLGQTTGMVARVALVVRFRSCSFDQRDTVGQRPHDGDSARNASTMA
jgi:hypothetical protein